MLDVYDDGNPASWGDHVTDARIQHRAPDSERLENPARAAQT